MGWTRSSGDATPDWLIVALEEYRSLRGEVEASVGAQQQILGFGTATLALVIGPGLGLWKTSQTVMLLLFNLFVPVLASMVVVIWFGEVLRMVRAGDAVADLERRINAAGQHGAWKGPALTWECRLREEVGGNLMKSFVINYQGVLGAFCLIAGVSMTIGFLRDLNEETHVRSLTIGLTAASVVLIVGVVFFMKAQWGRERDKWRTRTRRYDAEWPLSTAAS